MRRSRSSQRPHRVKNTPDFKARLSVEVLEERTLLNGDPYLPPSYLLTNPTGLLSGPAEGQPLDIARTYLTDHAADFGLAPDDLSDSAVTSQYTDDDTGITHVYLRQHVHGLEGQYADIGVSLTS